MRSCVEGANVLKSSPWQKLALFLVLNLFDLLLTRLLVVPGNHHARELNPVANWFLHSWGWMGLTGFKLGMVLLVIAALQFIAIHRPRVAACLLEGGCYVLAAVVLYSGYAIATNGTSGWAVKSQDERRHCLDNALKRTRQRGLLLEQTIAKLIDAPSTLCDAVPHVIKTLPSDNRWLAALRSTYPAPTDEESIAGLLVSRVAVHLGCTDQPTPGVLERLHEIFEELYGRAPPLPRVG